SNNQTFTSKPTSNLCLSGNASSVSGTGPWTWTCYGQNGGSSIKCSANKKADINNAVNGVCGYSFGEILNSVPPLGTICKSGIASDIKPHYPDGAGPWTWTCYGSNGGSDTECLVNEARFNDSCGKAIYGYFYSQPSSENLCSNKKQATGISYYQDKILWNCEERECVLNLIKDGQCGQSNGKDFTFRPSTNLCAVGTASEVIENKYSYTWTCSGINYGKTASCSSSRVYDSTDGKCGSSNGQAFYNAPSSGLCEIGVTSSIIGSGPWQWTCSGSNGGLDASCFADLRNNILLVVDNNTYNELSNEILRLEKDIEKENKYTASILSGDWPNPDQLRNSLVQSYEKEKLAGAILIGDIPIVYLVTEYQGKNYPRVVSDYFYQKLDKEEWVKQTSNTVVQSIDQKSAQDRSIWTSRLYVPTINNFNQRTNILKDYFDRNHDYRIGEISYDKKMLFVDSQSAELLKGKDIYPDLKNLVDNIPNYTNLYDNFSYIDIAYALDPEERKQDIMEKAKNNYEIMIINVHGSPTSQWIGESTYIASEEIKNIKPGSLFIALESCSNGDFSNPNYIAGWYLFSGQSLLVKANSTVTFYVGAENYLLRPEYFIEGYRPISNGSDFGEIYRVDNGGQQLLLFGDPTLSIR
ncbi:MAG: hypothetical protein PHI45_03380, partial [Candidatus Pacebacteria bacterium]|nr:hypothetical protein [Candidatus Paceibacterota bacterium]